MFFKANLWRSPALTTLCSHRLSHNGSYLEGRTGGTDSSFRVAVSGAAANKIAPSYPLDDVERDE